MEVSHEIFARIACQLAKDCSLTMWMTANDAGIVQTLALVAESYVLWSSICLFLINASCSFNHETTSLS